jgi:hypothetical protein
LLNEAALLLLLAHGCFCWPSCLAAPASRVALLLLH